MNIAQKTISVLNAVSNDLHGLTLEAVFSKKLIDENKSHTIKNIKSNISQASDALNKLNIVNDDTVQALDNVVKECISSLHEIHLNMHQYLINQNAEDDYAELSAQIVCLHEQLERIKNS